MLLKTKDATRLGIHPRTLYAMHGAGIIRRISRGIYQLMESEPLGNIDIITVAVRVPNGVVCLISALAFHDLTTQIPHEVYLALQPGSRRPRIVHPPLRTFLFSGRAFSEGIKTCNIDGIDVLIYCPEKTITDCFKYRNMLGLDIAVEALKAYLKRANADIKLLIHYSRICRVEKVMTPYIEAMV